MIVDIQHDKQIHEFFVNWNLSFSLSFSSCFRECKGIHYAWSLTLIISPCIPAKLFEEYAGYLTELALRKVLPSQRSKSMNSEYWFILKHFVINVWNKQSQLFPSSWLSKLVQDNKQFPTGTLFLHQLSWWIYSSYHYLIFLTLLPQFSLRSAKGRNQLRNNPCIYHRFRFSWRYQAGLEDDFVQRKDGTFSSYDFFFPNFGSHLMGFLLWLILHSNGNTLT
jgi:hypothetical protein